MKLLNLMTPKPEGEYYEVAFTERSGEVTIIDYVVQIDTSDTHVAMRTRDAIVFMPVNLPFSIYDQE